MRQTKSPRTVLKTGLMAFLSLAFLAAGPLWGQEPSQEPSERPFTEAIPNLSLEGADLPLFTCVRTFLTDMPLDGIARRSLLQEVSFKKEDWRKLVKARIEAQHLRHVLSEELGKRLEEIRPLKDKDWESYERAWDESSYGMTRQLCRGFAEIYQRLLADLDAQTAFELKRYVQPPTCASNAVVMVTGAREWDTELMEIYREFEEAVGRVTP